MPKLTLLSDAATAEAPEEPASPAAGPPMLPEQWFVDQAMCADGRVRIVVRITGPWGVMLHMLDPEVARKLGVRLQALGSAGDLVMP